MHQREINSAAMIVRRRMIIKAGGRLPRSLRGWKTLCLECGLDVVPVFRDTTGFTACLIETPRGWTAFHTHHATARQKMKFLCHELAEFLCQGDYAPLWEPVFRGYTGGDPHDTRHRIAKEVERLCFRR
jgi:hypothetical protein